MLFWEDEGYAGGYHENKDKEIRSRSDGQKVSSGSHVAKCFSRMSSQGPKLQNETGTGGPMSRQVCCCFNVLLLMKCAAI